MTSNCWFLWQRMPPRYQLTLRDVPTEGEVDLLGRSSSESRSGEQTPRSPRPRTPGARCRNCESPRTKPVEVSVTLPRQGPEDGPREAEDRPGPTPVLPARHSAYISNRKNLMRLNSGRRWLDEGLLTGPVPADASKTKCHGFFPFPVTKLANYCQDMEARMTAAPAADWSKRHVTSCQKKSMSSSGMRPASAMAGYTTVAFQTVSPFSEVADCRVSPSRQGLGPSRHRVGTVCDGVGTVRDRVSTARDRLGIALDGVGTARDGVGTARDGVGTARDGVGDYQRFTKHQDAIMGDVLTASSNVEREKKGLYRQSRVDVGQTLTCSTTNPFLVSRDDNAYLAHLRRLYLKGVRDLAKTSDKEPDTERQNTFKERIEYDRKVGRILEYYAHVDLPLDVRSQSRPRRKAESFSVNLQQSPGLVVTRRPCRGPSDQTLAHRDAASGERETYVTWQTQGQGHSHEVVSQNEEQLWSRGSSEYVRINYQAKLHRRQFYLHTPAKNRQCYAVAGTGEMARCLCAMCRVEMELALMTGMHDLRLPLQTFAMRTSVTLENKSSAATTDILPNREAQTSHMTAAMPTRGQVMDRPPAEANSLLPQSVMPDHRRLLSGDEEKGQLGFPFPVEKPTCLTVKLPGAEYSKSRTAESGNLELESEIKESSVEDLGDSLRYTKENVHDDDHLTKVGKNDEASSPPGSEEAEEGNENRGKDSQPQHDATKAHARNVKININTYSATEDAEDILPTEEDGSAFCAASVDKTFEKPEAKDADVTRDVECEDAVSKSFEGSGNDF